MKKTAEQEAGEPIPPVSGSARAAGRDGKGAADCRKGSGDGNNATTPVDGAARYEKDRVSAADGSGMNRESEAAGSGRRTRTASCGRSGAEPEVGTRDKTVGRGRQRLSDALQAGFDKGMNHSIGRVIARNGWWDEALDLAFHADGRIAFRASWCLERAYHERPDDFLPYVPRLLNDFLRSNHGSVLRTYSKMLCGMLRHEILRPDAGQREAISEKCFDLLIDPGTRPAVKVWAMEILCDFRQQVGWIGELLEDSVRSLSQAQDCTPAMSAHCRKILQRIARENTRNR